MPTVFRNKMGTVFQTGALDARSIYAASQSEASIAINRHNYTQRETSLQKKQAENNANQSQRVEYMLITKRIEMKDQDEEPTPEHFVQESLQPEVQPQPKTVTPVEK